MKKLSIFIITILFLGILFSCQQIFTYSPVSWAQRDPSKLPPEQKIAYAEEALASGDSAAVEAAYNALKDSTDPDTQALVSQLAVSASGLDDAIAEALSTMTLDDTIIAGIDGTWLTNAVTAMDTADSGSAEVTPEEYLTVAAALVVLDAQTNGIDTTTGNISDTSADKNGTDLEKAVYYAEAAGYTQADLESMFSL